MSRAEKWGYEASLYAQNWVKGEKVQSIFAIFRACKTASFVDTKHGKSHLSPVFDIVYNADYQHFVITPTPHQQ